MTDDEIQELWLKLLNVRSYEEAFSLLREVIPSTTCVIEQDVTLPANDVYILRRNRIDKRAD